jgi:hypothetical protein
LITTLTLNETRLALLTKEGCTVVRLRALGALQTPRLISKPPVAMQMTEHCNTAYGFRDDIQRTCTCMKTLINNRVSLLSCLHRRHLATLTVFLWSLLCAYQPESRFDVQSCAPALRFGSRKKYKA